MRKSIIYLASLFFICLAMQSCKKDDDSGSGTKAVFSYVADGYKVNFTNFSSNATEYLWDFGDQSGMTSTSKTPQHIYTKKGDFLVSLTAKNGTEQSVFIDSVSIIGPNIKVDGDFTDWQYVDYAYTNPAGEGGNLIAVKTFASSTDINFLLEGTADMKIELFDMYLDSDNDPATGFSTYLYPAGSGADILAEGSPLGFGDVFRHSGPPTGFSFTPVASFAEAMSFSAIKTVSGKQVIEFSVKRSALGTIKNFVNFCFVELTSGYASVGIIPESLKSDSKFLAIPL